MSLKSSRLFLGILVLSLCAGCMGRKKDETTKQPFHIELGQLGIQSEGADKPILLAFGALWCQPCRAEIDDLNEAFHKYRGKVDIIGVVTEGYVKGELVQERHFADFDSVSGKLPEYRLVADQNWEIFDALNTRDGHRLPTMVLLDSEKRIISIIQRTLDYENELEPMLASLASGQEEIDVVEPIEPEIPAEETPTDGGTTKPADTRPRQMLVADWKTLIANENPAADLIPNMKAAWTKAMIKFNFKKSNVPFDDGDLSVRYVDDFPVPVRAYWAYTSVTGGQCSLSIYFKQDGSYRTSNGVCQ